MRVPVYGGAGGEKHFSVVAVSRKTGVLPFTRNEIRRVVWTFGSLSTEQ